MRDQYSEKPLHSRLLHAYLRIQAGALLLASTASISLLFVLGISALSSVIHLLLLGIFAFWVLGGRYWAVYLTESELVARRFGRERRVPLSQLQDIARPWYVALYAYLFNEQRLLVRDGPPLTFICSSKGYAQIRALLGKQS